MITLILTVYTWVGATAMYAAAYGVWRANKRNEARSKQQELLILEDIQRAARLRAALRQANGLPSDNEPVTADEIEQLRRAIF